VQNKKSLIAILAAVITSMVFINTANTTPATAQEPRQNTTIGAITATSNNVFRILLKLLEIDILKIALSQLQFSELPNVFLGESTVSRLTGPFATLITI
jgi:hypothetical protein